MFRINAGSERRGSQMQRNPLYLYGVRAHEVGDVLTRAFESNFKSCVSKNFETEFSNGRSLCNVDDNFTKLSFIFVAIPTHPVSYGGEISDRDSNGNFISGGSFRNNTDTSDHIILAKLVLDMVPKYLIVLEA